MGARWYNRPPGTSQKQAPLTRGPARLARCSTAPMRNLLAQTRRQGRRQHGKDQAETVTAVFVHHDTDLHNLTVKTLHGTEVMHTTSNRLFWDGG
jgi:hypothetical protein